MATQLLNHCRSLYTAESNERINYDSQGLSGTNVEDENGKEK